MDSKEENMVEMLARFLKENPEEAEKLAKEISDKEMLYTMIDDWIHDLRLKRASAKTEA